MVFQILVVFLILVVLIVLVVLVVLLVLVVLVVSLTSSKLKAYTPAGMTTRLITNSAIAAVTEKPGNKKSSTQSSGDTHNARHA